MQKIGYTALLVIFALSAQAEIFQAWEFNTPGDTEGWYENGQFSGLTVQAAVNGAETVLTCADVTGNDPNVSFSTTQWYPDAGDTWSTFEMRVRLLDGNGGNSLPWISSRRRCQLQRFSAAQHTDNCKRFRLFKLSELS